jgi:hypothetical protein
MAGVKVKHPDLRALDGVKASASGDRAVKVMKVESPESGGVKRCCRTEDLTPAMVCNCMLPWV